MVAVDRLQVVVEDILLVVAVVGMAAVGILVVDRGLVVWDTGSIVVEVDRVDLVVDMHFEGSALDKVLVVALDCKQVEGQLQKRKQTALNNTNC